MKRALLALILALPLALSAQFRIVGTGLFTTLNDSTYRAKIDFRPDLTGNSYNATQLTDSMLVLSQKGQLYRLDSFYNASFSSAFIIVVEKNGNWGSPVGQVMVFQNNSSLAAPQAVYGANGATAGMQAGVDTWNALLLKVVSDSAVYWNQAYSNSIDSLNVSGDSLKTITLYRAGGDSISATFVDGGGSGPVTDTLHGEVKGPLDSTYIDTVANIIFTTTTDTTVGVGELEYNDTQGSLIQGLKGGNVTNVIGQQIHQRVTNATGGPLTKGTAVFLHGSQGNRITVRKALATADSTSANTFGIVAESIADNQSGYVITEGLITNINTNALTEGAAVYLSPTVAGELTTTKPQAPQHTVYIGVCVKQNAGSGELFVKIRNGQELDELHDVRIDSPASNASLYYNTSESVWRDTTAAALKSDISGTTNRLAMFTGSNTVGNSVVDVTSDTVSIRDYSNSYTTWRFHSNINKRGFIGYPSGTRFYSLVNPSLYAGFMYGDRSAGVQDQQAFTQLTAYNGGGAASGFFSAATTLNGADSTLYFNISGLSANANPTFPAAQMVIQKGGNVGINTTTPAHRLDVNGDVNTTGMYKKSGTDIISGTTNYIPKFTGANTIGNSAIYEINKKILVNSTSSITTFNLPTIELHGNGSDPTTDQPIIAISANNGNSAISRGYLNLNRSGGTTAGNTTLVPYNYFIGTLRWVATDGIEPRSGAEISAITDSITGLSDMPTALTFATTANGAALTTERMRITSAGNVGIATSSPSRPLHVNANTSMIIPSGATGTRPASGADGDLRYSTTFSNIEFYRTNRWMRPLVGTVANNKVAFALGDTLTSNTNFHWDNTTTKLGIGNASPDSTLTVTGGIRATTGVTAARFTATGSSAPTNGMYLPATNALAFSTNSTERMRILSDGKVGINVTPTEQLQVGGTVRAERLSVNTYSSQVLSINNYSGSGTGLNIWIGTGGQSTTTGQQNAAIGGQAMQNNTTGNYNMAIGSDALKANTSGSANVSVGVAAMIFNTEGSYNTAVGQGALTKSTNSSHNVAIGQEALGAYTEIGQGGNIAIGNASISAKTTGPNDIAIGRFSGYFNNTIYDFADLNTNSNSSVYIGNFTRTGGNNRENQIIIGHQAIGNGSNTTTIGNSSTTATIFQYGETRLGMAVDSGAYRLQVNGDTKLIGNLARKKPVTIAAATYTVLSDDSWLICNHTSPITITLPTAANSIGRELMIKYVAGGGATVISNATNVSPIVGGALTNIILPATAGSWVTLVCDGVNWIIMQKG